MPSINWLHLTDLHWGLDRAGWLWPGVRSEFVQDLSRMGRRLGGWDLVFFTGDFTQQGAEQEFERVGKELESLWEVLSVSGTGKVPVLCAIPGNHDIVRPHPGSAQALALTRLWSEEPSLREAFWADEGSEHRQAVNSYFANYSRWLSKLAVPQIESVKGILPGDFGAQISFGDLTLGVVGLNTTFLQISSGDFEKRLDVHASQLHAVCGGDVSSWFRRCTTAVLLTHQPPSWFSPRALAHFRQEIYLPGRFVAQLCGHLHEPSLVDTAEAGATPRRLRQAPSLFGLEEWQGGTPTKRLHGYTAGQFVIDGPSALERLFPRSVVLGRDGALRLCPDQSYRLDEENCVTTEFDIGRADEVDAGAPTREKVVLEAQSPGAMPSPLEVTTIEGGREKLVQCPRLGLNFGAQHRHVRLDERSEAEHALRKQRRLWLTAEWGTGTDEFVATVLERFKTSDVVPDAFRVQCDEASDVDKLQSLFAQQFGMQLQTMCTFAAPLSGCFLVFDGVSPQLVDPAVFVEFQRVIDAIADYCPELKIVAVSRVDPPLSSRWPVVELRGLDVPDVRLYVAHHTEAAGVTIDPDGFERLYEHSDGLPVHLDRLLRSLKVSSLAAVLELDQDRAKAEMASIEDAPRGLVGAVATLTTSEERRSQRTLRMLKALAVLPYGETLDTLWHYLPNEPFFDDNALQLKSLGLVDVVPANMIRAGEDRVVRTVGDQDLPKLIRLRRQVRDFILTLTNDEEANELIEAGLERFFGRRWREGKVRLRHGTSAGPASGAGNEFALLHNVLRGLRDRGDATEIPKAVELARQYSLSLKQSNRWRDLTTVANGLLQVVDRDDYPSDWARLAALAGEGLRMTGKREAGRELLKEALSTGASALDRGEKASIWIDIALSYQGASTEAAAAAKEVLALAAPDSSFNLHARAIIAGATLSGVERTTKCALWRKERGGRVLRRQRTI